jgi:hypothetical protein
MMAVTDVEARSSTHRESTADGGLLSLAGWVEDPSLNLSSSSGA